MKRLMAFILSALLVVTSFIQPNINSVKAESEGDLLLNGGFENLTTGSGWKDNQAPVGTSTYTVSGQLIYSVDTNISHSGSNSAKIEANVQSRGALIQQSNQIEVGETYLISGWMKTEKISNKGLVRFQINRTGTANTLVNIKEMSGSNDWTYFERAVKIPENSTLMKIETFLENSTGGLWIDDFSIKKIVELEQLTIIPSTLSMNLEETKQLELDYTPANTSERAIIWSSSNESVVSVSDDGRIEALKNGYSLITATSKNGEISSTAAVSVDASEALSIEDYNGTAVNGLLSGQLIATDSGDAPIEFSVVVEPKHGIVNVRPDGSFSYYPEDSYTGKDEFIFMADTGKGGPKFAIASITVEGMEVRPDLDLLWYSVGKNEMLQGKLEKVVYPEPEDLTWAKVKDPIHGQVTIDANGSFQYTPESDYVGFDEFKVTVQNNSGQSAEDRVKVFVLPDAKDFVARMGGSESYDSHPRLLGDGDRFNKIRSQIGKDPYMTEWYDLLKVQADAILKTSPFPYASNGSNYGGIRDRLIITSLMYQLSKDDKYAQRAVEELEAITAYPDWFARTNNMLPLAELSFSIALAYDWLHDYMTSEQSEQFAQAIREKSLNVALEWYEGKFRHNGEFNNINLVNNGGFALAALAIIDKGEEEQQAASKVLRGAYTKLQQTLRFYTDDGAWLEGPAYWHYGGQYLTYMMAGMHNVLGTDYGLADLQGIENSGEFPVHLLGEGGFFNFYDGGISMAQPESMWYADFYNRPDFAWHLGDLYRRKGVFNPLYLVLYKDGMFDKQPKKLDRTFTGIETISMRSAWNNPNALFAAMKGFNDTLLSHHDLDAGSFVFDALGVRWALDVGNEAYDLPGFWDYNHTRYTYYRKTAEGHNTIVVNPAENPVMQQQHNAKAMMIKSESKPRGAYGIIDMTDRYPKDAVSMQRGIMMTEHRKELIIQDEMMLKKPSELYWFMHTTADIEIIEEGQAAILREKDKKLYVKLLEAPKGAVFSEMDAKPLPSSPNPDGQAINHGIKKLAVHMKNIEQATLSVWMVPLFDSEDLPVKTPTNVQLSEWSIPDGELIEPPARPKVNDIQVNGSTIKGFDPNTTFYEVIVPLDQDEAPQVEVDSEYDVNIIPAEGIPGRTLIEVVDPNNPDVKNIYTILFDNGPIEGELPAVNKLSVAEVTASAVPEPVNTPENTIDGDLNTRWSASGEQWIQYDLGKAQEVGAISIAYMNGNERIYYFDIQASMDGENWTKLYNGQSSGMTIQPELFPVPETKARYIRINSRGNSSNNWNSLTEVGIFKPSPIYLRLAAPESFTINETVQLTPTWIYGDGRRVEAKDITFTSSDSNILEVSKQGKVRGKHFGTAAITVKDRNGFERTVEMTVVKPGHRKGRDIK